MVSVDLFGKVHPCPEHLSQSLNLPTLCLPLGPGCFDKDVWIFRSTSDLHLVYHQPSSAFSLSNMSQVVSPSFDEEVRL